MQRLCMAFDIFWGEKEFDTCDLNDEKVIGRYMKMLNMKQYRGSTFDDALDNGFEFSGDRIQEPKKRLAMVDQYGNAEDLDEKLDPKLVEQWGYGFTPIDYQLLNAHYKYLHKANPHIDSNQEIFIQDLCYIYMQKQRALKSDNIDDYNKLTESYRKSFKQAGLQTEQDSAGTAEGTWSEWVSMFSQYTPEEYYRDKQRYVDHDGIGEYYKRMIIRPEKNIENCTQIRDEEFFVHEDGDDD